jgi:hypothetical protein
MDRHLLSTGSQFLHDFSDLQSRAWISILILNLCTSNSQAGIQMRLRIPLGRNLSLRLLALLASLFSTIFTGFDASRVP